MEPVTMWTIGVVVLVLPFVLTLALNGTDQSDSRGRRIRRSWTGRPLRF